MQNVIIVNYFKTVIIVRRIILIKSYYGPSVSKWKAVELGTNCTKCGRQRGCQESKKSNTTRICTLPQKLKLILRRSQVSIVERQWNLVWIAEDTITREDVKKVRTSTPEYYYYVNTLIFSLRTWNHLKKTEITNWIHSEPSTKLLLHQLTTFTSNRVYINFSIHSG